LAALIKYVEMSRLDQAIRHIIVSQAEHLAWFCWDWIVLSRSFPASGFLLISNPRTAMSRDMK
jgi:hypothetical protein